MRRREALVAAGSVGITLTAGCAGLGSTTVSTPDEQQADDGETNLRFQADDGTEVATLTVQPGRKRYSGVGGGQMSVDVAITHGDETTITGLELTLRAPPSGADSPAEVALRTPFGTPHPSMELYAHPEGEGTVLAIDEMGEQGDGTMVLQFLLTGLRDAVSELKVDATVELAGRGVLGRKYTLDGLTLVSLPEKQ